jgi:16S rRNA (guanine966-N2)-methyltransferase
MDPPYGHQLEKKAMQAIAESGCAQDDVLIIIEADLNTDFSYLGGLGYTIDKIKKYKTNQHVFVRKVLE